MMDNNFDLRLTKAKNQINDALRVSQRVGPKGAPPNKERPPVNAFVAPQTYQMPAGAPNPTAQFGAPPTGPFAPQDPMASRFGGIQAGLQGQAGGININLSPRGQFQGADANANAGDFDFNASVNNAMQLQALQARYSPQGPFSASANYTAGQGVGGELQYQDGGFSAGGGYGPSGPHGNLGYTRRF